MKQESWGGGICRGKDWDGLFQARNHFSNARGSSTAFPTGAGEVTCFFFFLSVLPKVECGVRSSNWSLRLQFQMAAPGERRVSVHQFHVPEEVLRPRVPTWREGRTPGAASSLSCGSQGRGEKRPWRCARACPQPCRALHRSASLARLPPWSRGGGPGSSGIARAGDTFPRCPSSPAGAAHCGARCARRGSLGAARTKELGGGSLFKWLFPAQPGQHHGRG